MPDKTHSDYVTSIIVYSTNMVIHYPIPATGVLSKSGKVTLHIHEWPRITIDQAIITLIWIALLGYPDDSVAYLAVSNHTGPH